MVVLERKTIRRGEPGRWFEQGFDPALPSLSAIDGSMPQVRHQGVIQTVSFP